MSDINELVQLSLLQETIIDKILDFFDGRKIPNIKYQKFFDDLEQITKPKNIMFIVNKKDNINVSGSHLYNPTIQKHIITLNIPTLMTNKNEAEAINVLLHELTHVISDNEIPNVYLKKSKDKKRLLTFTRGIQVDFYDYQDFNKEQAKTYLNYIFHIREISNFAFTFAFSIHYDYNHAYTIEKLFQMNKDIIYAHLKNKNQITFENLDNYIHQHMYGDMVDLFITQFTVYKLNETKYNNLLIKMFKLIQKYDRRLYLAR